MTDDQWRRALDTYAQPRPERFWPRRGVHEFARTLGSRAQQHPDRFTDFAFTLGPGSPAAYLCAIAEAVTPCLDADRWERLALHTHQTLGSEAASTICRALQSAPQNGTPALLPALGGYTTDLGPEHDIRDPDADGTRTDLLTAGMNATRGQAALTVAALPFHDSQHLHVLTPLITRLANDPVLAVRVCAAEAVLALMKHDPQAALDVADQLLTYQDTNVHNAPTTQQLLIHALVRNPSRFAPYLGRRLYRQSPPVLRAERCPGKRTLTQLTQTRPHLWLGRATRPAAAERLCGLEGWWSRRDNSGGAFSACGMSRWLRRSGVPR
jgi:hypothetical protein